VPFPSHPFPPPFRRPPPTSPSQPTLVHISQYILAHYSSKTPFVSARIRDRHRVLNAHDLCILRIRWHTNSVRCIHLRWAKETRESGATAIYTHEKKRMHQRGYRRLHRSNAVLCIYI